MARPKKDGVPFSVYIDRQLLDEVRQCQAIKDWTLTTAIEKLLRRGLDSIYNEENLRRQDPESREE